MIVEALAAAVHEVERTFDPPLLGGEAGACRRLSDLVYRMGYDHDLAHGRHANDEVVVFPEFALTPIAADFVEHFATVHKRPVAEGGTDPG